MKTAHKLGMLLGAVLVASATTGTAQVVGLGTTQAGATNQLSVGIAKVVSDKGGVQMRTQPMAGAAQYGPLVNTGEIEFGIANLVETHYLREGKVITEGRANPELRAVARLVPWYNGLVVKADSPIKTLRDLKGQPVPAGFSGNPLGKVLIQGYLANAGMTYDDVKQVPIPAFPRMFDAFKQQQTVTTIATIGAAQFKEWEAALGGVRYLAFDDSPQAVAALQKYIPHSQVVEVKPGPGMSGIPVPTKILVYDYVLFAASKVSDEVVGKVAAALHANPQDLKESSPLWRDFDPALMSKEMGLPWHPGAVKFYQSKSIWPGKK
jgi:TRAP transporter TAXI family solute receptor